MARFLSDAWLDEMAAVADRVPGFSPERGGEAMLRLRQVVTGGPRGDVTYDLCLGREGVRIERNRTADADVTFAQDHGTACRLAQGATHPQVELTAGHLQVSGAANRLTGWRPLLDDLDEALAELRATTTW